MRKPIVVHLIEALGFGGAETHIYRLATHLRQGRYEPLVCCLSGSPRIAALKDQGVQVITLDISRHSIVLFPLFLNDVVKAILKLILLIRRRKVDIIHTHLPDCAILGGIAGKLSGAEVVATYHGLKILPFDRKKNDPRNYLRMIFYRFAGILAYRSIAVSEEVKDLMVRAMHVEPHKILVINNGIDTEDYGKPIDLETVCKELGLVFDDKVVTFVGRLVSNKGHKYLIMAAQVVIRYYPNTKFLLVGNGPTLGELTDLVSKLSLEKHVKFLGERSDIPNILAITNVFVLPSFAEGISLALLEAMAAGKPVVATAVPGNRDVVVDKETGLLVPAKDFEALGSAICKLLTDPHTAKRMGASGRVRVRKHFNFQKTLHKTEQIYNKAMIKKKLSRGNKAKR
jgi:glycosyltransferase involved in cell wall biosynthesis